jgi:hypothetical protein
MWLQENKHKEVANSLSMIHATSPQLRSGCHVKCHACKPCHQSKGGKPRRIRAWHMDFTWIHGPTRAPKTPQEHVYTRDRPKAPHDSHPKEARPEWGHMGVSWPLDRPNRPWVGWSQASTWCFSIGPISHPRGVSLLLALVLSPINRRGEGSFLTNTTYSSLTFGF